MLGQRCLPSSWPISRLAGHVFLDGSARLSEIWNSLPHWEPSPFRPLVGQYNKTEPRVSPIIVCVSSCCAASCSCYTSLLINAAFAGYWVFSSGSIWVCPGTGNTNIAGSRVASWWFDPRYGTAQMIYTGKNGRTLPRN